MNAQLTFCLCIVAIFGRAGGDPNKQRGGSVRPSVKRFILTLLLLRRTGLRVVAVHWALGLGTASAHAPVGLLRAAIVA